MKKTITLAALAASASFANAALIQVGTGGITAPGITPSGYKQVILASTAIDQTAFTTAGLWDSGTSTVGGGTISGSLFIAFNMTPLDRGASPDPTPNLSFAGAQIMRGGSDQTALGESWNGVSYGYFDNGTGLVDSPSSLLINKGVTVMGIMQITFNASANDNITVKVSDDGGTTFRTKALTNKNMSFDAFQFISGHQDNTVDNGWEWSNVAYATTQAEAIAALAPVPEPSTTALLGLGGLALILRRRK